RLQGPAGGTGLRSGAAVASLSRPRGLGVCRHGTRDKRAGPVSAYLFPAPGYRHHHCDGTGTDAAGDVPVCAESAQVHAAVSGGGGSADPGVDLVQGPRRGCIHRSADTDVAADGHRLLRHPAAAYGAAPPVRHVQPGTAGQPGAEEGGRAPAPAGGRTQVPGYYRPADRTVQPSVVAWHYYRPADRTVQPSPVRDAVSP